MNKYLYAAALSILASPVLANSTHPVPEMSGGAGIAAIALIAGLAAIIREKTTGK